MQEIRQFIEQAFREDVREGDHTSMACIPEDAMGKAHLLVKEAGILSGMEVGREVFAVFDPSVRFQPFLRDGDKIHPGDIAFEVEGRVVSLLQCERLALNFMQRMSGIATQTARYVAEVAGTGARILDTRKTTPNMRFFEKMAVRHGGGMNHRMGLYDMIMIKDNHVDFAGGIRKALERISHYQKIKNLTLPVVVEVRNMEELQQVLHHGGVTRVLLDNFTIEQLSEAIALIQGRVATEASGGITEKDIASVARTGVDFISVGALTHHIRSLDLSLKAL